MSNSDSNELRLAGNVAFVTGAASGIGRAVSVSLSRAGASVVVSTYAEIAGAEATVQLIRDSGGDATFAQSDVGQLVDVQRLIEETVHRFGRLDCAVNNAGVTCPALPTAGLEDKDWYRIIAINLKRL